MLNFIANIRLIVFMNFINNFVNNLNFILEINSLFLIINIYLINFYKTYLNIRLCYLM